MVNLIQRGRGMAKDSRFLLCAIPIKDGLSSYSGGGHFLLSLGKITGSLGL